MYKRGQCCGISEHEVNLILVLVDEESTWYSFHMALDAAYDGHNDVSALDSHTYSVMLFDEAFFTTLSLSICCNAHFLCCPISCSRSF